MDRNPAAAKLSEAWRLGGLVIVQSSKIRQFKVQR